MLIVGTRTNDLNQIIDIDVDGLLHHTLVVGQSGGGKSFLVARLLEEILLRTRARVVVIDPNGDFRQICTPSTKIWGEFKDLFEQLNTLTKKRNLDGFDKRETFLDGWKKRRFAYLTAGRTPHKKESGSLSRRLLIHWDTLEEEQRTFLLNASAKGDPKSFLGLKAITENLNWKKRSRSPVRSGFDLRSMLDVCEQFADSHIGMRPYEYAKFLEREDWQAIRANLEDLLANFSVWWSPDDGYLGSRPAGLADFIDGAFGPDLSLETYWDSLVLSLDSARPTDTLLAADVVLSRVWKRAKEAWRTQAENGNSDGIEDNRVPTFIVVDEAHNFAPESSSDPMKNRVTARLMQIASEGRKYGLYLILATQRPTKLHRELVPECENACVLRLQSKKETDFASGILGLSNDEATQVPGFTLGQGVFFGRWVGGTTQLNTKIAPARIQVGGGGLDNKWKELPESTPEIAGLSDTIAKFVEDTLLQSERPIDLASLVVIVRNRIGKEGTEDWFGHGTFKKYILNLGISSLKTSAIPPGTAYLEGVHEKPSLDFVVPSIKKMEASVQSPMSLVTGHLGMPMTEKENFKALLDVISEEVQINSFNLTDTSKAVRDKCVSLNVNVGRNLVNFILKGLHYGGHNFDQDLDQSPKALAVKFTESVLHALRTRSVEIDEETEKTIVEYLSGGLLSSN